MGACCSQRRVSDRRRLAAVTADDTKQYMVDDKPVHPVVFALLVPRPRRMSSSDDFHCQYAADPLSEWNTLAQVLTTSRGSETKTSVTSTTHGTRLDVETRRPAKPDWYDQHVAMISLKLS